MLCSLEFLPGTTIVSFRETFSLPADTSPPETTPAANPLGHSDSLAIND